MNLNKFNVGIFAFNASSGTTITKHPKAWKAEMSKILSLNLTFPDSHYRALSYNLSIQRLRFRLDLFRDEFCSKFHISYILSEEVVKELGAILV